MKFIIDRGGGGGRGGRGRWRLQGNRLFSPPATMTSSLASVTFKMANKVFIEETDTNFELSRQFWFLGPGDFKIPIVIEKQTLALFWNETSSGVMNFKISFYRLAYFTGNQTDRSHFLGPVHSKMKECWHSNRRFIKWYIILYIVCTFNSSEPVEPHINPFKVRLAGSVERRR